MQTFLQSSHQPTPHKLLPLHVMASSTSCHPRAGSPFSRVVCQQPISNGQAACWDHLYPDMQATATLLLPPRSQRSWQHDPIAALSIYSQRAPASVTTLSSPSTAAQQSLHCPLPEAAPFSRAVPFITRKQKRKRNPPGTIQWVEYLTCKPLSHSGCCCHDPTACLQSPSQCAPARNNPQLPINRCPKGTAKGGPPPESRPALETFFSPASSTVSPTVLSNTVVFCSVQRSTTCKQ